jgi:hypothetical protein
MLQREQEGEENRHKNMSDSDLPKVICILLAIVLIYLIFRYHYYQRFENNCTVKRIFSKIKAMRSSKQGLHFQYTGEPQREQFIAQPGIVSKSLGHDSTDFASSFFNTSEQPIKSTRDRQAN